MTGKKTQTAAKLLRWYDRRRRTLPWRAARGKKPNPYHVLLSEFMLQQTTIAAVIPYFRKFLEQWPTLEALAAASLEDVRAAWSGLGYYRRAKFLHAAAQAVVARHGGAIPQDEAALRALPGIGAYTAAALAAIAFNRRANVVDGNVERVVARLFAVKEALPKAKAQLRARAETLLPEKRYGDYAQALMDLGATLCTPRAPACVRCPLCTQCAAHAEGKPETYPRRAAKKAVPHKYAVIFVAQNGRGHVLMRRRAEEGLFAGLWEFPSTPWEEAEPDARAIRRAAPVKATWRVMKSPVRHIFSHFHLSVTVHAGFTSFSPKQGDYVWIAPDKMGSIGLPSLMKKILHAVKSQT